MKNKTKNSECVDRVINVVTDTPTLFEAGNSIYGFMAHPVLGVANIAFCAFVAAIRNTSECIKRNQSSTLDSDLGDKSTLSSIFQKFSGNLGASLEASGGILISIAILGSVTSIAVPTIQLMPLAIIGAFGCANLARGSAMRFSECSTVRKFLDTAGIGLAAAGCVMTAPGSPLFIKAAFAAAAVMEASRSMTNKWPSNGVADVAFAGALAMNAAYAPSSWGAVANGLFSMAFLSLAALKTHGGVAEFLRAKIEGARSLFRDEKGGVFCPSLIERSSYLASSLIPIPSSGKN